MRLAPIPWHVDRPRPKAKAHSTRCSLGWHIGAGVVNVGHCQTLGYQVCPHILPTDRTDRHDAFIPVDVFLIAGNRLPPDQIAQCIGSHLTAAIGFARGILAKLFALWRVDAKQSEPLAVNVNGVTVNDSGDAHVGCGSGLMAVVFAGLAVLMASIGIQLANMG